VFGQAELVLFDGLNTELIAFVGNDIATGRLTPPPYLFEPFAGVLRQPAPPQPVHLADSVG
jgi:hypothetical protein